METSLILTNIGKHITLNDKEVDFFTALLKPIALKRRDLLLQAGDACVTFNFVNTGALRAFYRDEHDKEATIMFAVADWWITDMPCFVNQQPAMINIEAIADSSVLQLTKTDMDQLLIRVPKFERFFRILMQNAYVREQLRIIQNLSMPAEVRYHNFLKKYPAIIKAVTQKNIASYLGITPEFLSVIRNRNRNRIEKERFLNLP